MTTDPNVSSPAGEWTRRRFIQTAVSGAAGLVIGIHLPLKQSAANAGAGARDASSSPMLAPNAFVEIGRDDLVTVIVKHIEFGQGPLTGLATLVAEELDADWGQVRARLAHADVKLYAHTMAPRQLTGGSSAIANSYIQMRKAGATARAMLVEAAAAKWGVPAKELEVSDGVVRHSSSSGRTARFGALVEAASKLEAPADVELKDPKAFKLIGTTLPKLDTPAKTTGQTIYSIDVQRPGLLTALVAHPPRFGARVASFEAAKAKAVPGVVDVQKIPEGVAVYATGFWNAKKARDLLEIEWDESNTETRGSAEIISEYQALARTPGLPASRRGSVAQAFASAANVLEAEFVFPFLAHAPMETLDAVIEKNGDGYEIWMGAQGATRDHSAFAEELGVDVDRVKLNILFAGGSFGRRSQQDSQFAREVAHVSMAIGSRVPVKLIWTREDDIRGGFYRPIYVHRLKGALDEEGEIVAWEQVIVGQSLQQSSPTGAAYIKNGVDHTSVEGASNLSYDVPNLDVSLHSPEVGIPVLWWRSVGHTHTGFTSEAFIDELLVAAGKDPVEGRLALLGALPRHVGVLRAAAKMAGWRSAPPTGRARGVAVHKSFGTVVAQIVEVSRSAEDTPIVERVWCAVDCGVAVNPDIVKAQMEGGIGYGLGAAMRNQVDIEAGRVVQSNFHDYRPFRIDEMPRIEVEVLASAEAPSGVGEPGTPPIAPAVANAWAALTGQRLRKLPFASGA